MLSVLDRKTEKWNRTKEKEVVIFACAIFGKNTKANARAR
jgi:hypothetical protein